MGCVPLCPQELSLPNLGCANPRLVKVAGQCCEEWVCDDGKQTDILERIFGKDMLTDELERDLTNKNELISIVNGGLKSLPGKKAFPGGNLALLNQLLQEPKTVKDPNDCCVFRHLQHSDHSLKFSCLTTTNALSKPHPGLSAPRAAGLASPPGSPTTTASASWSRRHESVKCDPAPSHPTPV